jgi:hypothetical protein
MDTISRNNFDQLLDSSRFKSKVSRIIEENDFWKDLFKTLQIEQKIKIEVDRKMLKVKNNLMTLKSDALRDMLNKIPGNVALEIQSQLPKYLDQNATMQKMLNDHNISIQSMLDAETSKMTKILEEKARNILNEIVSDPQYHQIHKVYFDEFNKNAHAAIDDFVKRGESELQFVRENANRVEKDLCNQVSQTTDSLKNQLHKLSSLEQANEKLKKEVDSLHFQTNVSIALAIISFGASVFLFYR